MMDSFAWRTVITQPHDSLRLNGSCLEVVDGEESRLIPLEQIREIFISCIRGDITLPLLMELSRRGTMVVFCDEKYNPVCELRSQYNHYESAGRLMDQAAWTGRRADAVWARIVKQKLVNQAQLLEILCIPVPWQLREYACTVEAGDATNREGVGARLYFETLFGEGFVRHAQDDTNIALNYGYSIILSAVNRAITLCGYNTALGIHHVDRQNCFNLACDIMEPFRPFIDRIVASTMLRELNGDMKKKLAAVLGQDCLYEGRETCIADAILMYTRDVCDAMTNGSRSLAEVCFA